MLYSDLIVIKTKAQNWLTTQEQAMLSQFPFTGLALSFWSVSTKQFKVNMENPIKGKSAVMILK